MSVFTFGRLRFTLLSLMLLCGCATSQPGGTQTPGKGEKTLLAMYMIGGDLEDDVKPRNGEADEAETGAISTVGAGSNDLRELVSGYQALSPAQQQSLDILVAFGGSRKQGWKGVKYADMPCLIADAEDRYFGNASCYSYSDSEANLAESATLQHFLKTLASAHAQPTRRILQLWDHGFDYLGMGNDSLHGDDVLSLAELKTGLSQSGQHFDLLGFDACLMAGLEVARSLKSFGDYLVASEELSPAHGWNYADYLQILTGSATDFESIGKKLVDSFLDNADHIRQARKYKTLSLLDLRQVDGLLTAMDQLSRSLNLADFSHLLQALESSQKFGADPKSGAVFSIDLGHWLQNLSSQEPTAAPVAAQALEAMHRLVKYSRHDETKPDSNGISIFALNEQMRDQYGSEQAFSPAWLDFTRSFSSVGLQDSEPPQITRLASLFGIAQAAPDDLCNQAGKTGHCLTVTDNLGLRSVEQVFALRSQGRLFGLGSHLLKADTQGGYFAPVWDGEWFLLCDGSCENGLSLFPPAYFDSLTARDSRLYTTDAVLNGESVIFYLEVAANNAVISQWAVPYTLDQSGHVRPTRNQVDLVAGDTLQFWYQVLDPASGKQSWQKGQALTFTSKPVWSYARIDAERAYYIQADDYKGNLATSKLYEVKQK